MRINNNSCGIIKASKKQILTNGLLLGAISALSFPVYANGLFLPQQNVTNLGMAYAGTASLAEDASTAFYNPAGLTNIKADNQVVGGVVLVYPTTILNVGSATTTTGAATSPTTERVRPHNKSALPSFHYAYRYNDKISFGGSLVTTFGSKTNYKDDTIVRYVATKSELLTLNFAPSIAYQYTDKLSFAGGIDVLYSEIKLDKAVSLTTFTPATDGFFKHTGKERAAFGYHLALLYKYDKNTRFGINYRSDIVAKYSGKLDFKTASNSADSQLGISGRIHFPESITFSAYHDLNKSWAVMGDFQWIRSSRIDKIDLDYSDGAKAVFDYSYKNSYRAAVGTTYTHNDDLKFRFGVSFDRTPTKGRTRVVSLPEHNQVGVAFGAQYKLNKNFTFDAAYVRVFTNTANLNQQPATVTGSALPNGATVAGTSKILTDVFGLQFTYSY